MDGSQKEGVTFEICFIKSGGTQKGGGGGYLERGSGGRGWRGFLRKGEVQTLDETMSILYHLFISSPFSKSINVSHKIEVRHPTSFSLKHDIDLI